MVSRELAKLGPVSRGQRNVLLAFGMTVALWVPPGFFAIAGADRRAFARAYAASVPEGVAAMIGALLLVRPADRLADAPLHAVVGRSRPDRLGIVLLYGGGLAMGQLAFSTGLAAAMGEGLTSWLPSHTDVRADGAVHRRRHRPVGGDVEYRVGEHDRADRHCRLDRRRRPAASSRRSAPRSARRWAS